MISGQGSVKWKFILFGMLSGCRGNSKIGYHSTAYIDEGRKIERLDLIGKEAAISLPGRGGSLVFL